MKNSFFDNLWAIDTPINIYRRLIAACLHLTVSGIIALFTFCVVYFVWFPREYWYLSGGSNLFLLIVSVDIALGPLLTVAIFNPAKGIPRLKRDLIVILLLQLAALAYGLYTIALVRPI
jgi:ABC-type uncharacterized transport system permease subunit